MEKILISGDSWSNPNYKSRIHLDYKHTLTWPDMLKGDVTNVSVSGLDNVSIINNALQAIYMDKPDRVIIALSCWSRYATPEYRINPLFLFNTSAKNVNDRFKNNDDSFEYKRQVKHLAGMMGFTEDIHDVNNFLRDFISRNISRFVLNTSLALMNIIHICDLLNIKLHIFQTFSAFSCTKYTQLETQFEKELISSELFLDLYDHKAKVNLIGYPWIKNAGGLLACDVLDRSKDFIGNSTADRRNGQWDGHPNQDGHRKIGEWFNETHKDYEI
tara:strand:+ start:480 stop:1298 length:819 start_codon:yes stop_codon:yes gene_type:complete